MVNIFKKLIKFLPALLILLVAGGLSFYWLANKPRAARMPAAVVAPLVEIIEPQLGTHQTSINSLGTVIASQSVNLNSRVSGMVISVSQNFIEGGILKKGEQIVQLDPTDFRLSVQQRESELEQAKFNFKIEMGQQSIAKREFELLGGDLDDQARELVLRKPHLIAAQAKVKAAEAALALAKLELSRTVPVAPFNAIVTARNANIGSWISTFSTGTPLVKLVATDNFWIDVSIPLDKIRWIDIPGINSSEGASAIISYDQAWGLDNHRSGKVKRLKAEVEAEGRMAKVIVEVHDPLCLLAENAKSPPMILGSLVRVQIAGKTLEDVYALPETALHDGLTLWLLSENNTLQFVDVEPIWAQQGLIYLKADQLPAQPKIIVSNLSAPVENMRLRSQAETTQNSQGNL
ncbi:efflux transporter periplasmic adaptor subunit [Methylomonas lenta]|uniref:Efflux transporter periplasmic adaptor subunit n=1 Tax=Methylomonas lenta TaxID=980561 RepID=A0A177N7I2_9GAMM|nr:efflux RND transporter periplasmic adaptor subunit [Methylomonas lenta]OAI14018.1 efflux transporter periplasmic adaptor subunit [Methylomonas lenta]